MPDREKDSEYAIKVADVTRYTDYMRNPLTV